MEGSQSPRLEASFPVPEACVKSVRGFNPFKSPSCFWVFIIAAAAEFIHAGVQWAVWDQPQQRGNDCNEVIVRSLRTHPHPLRARLFNVIQHPVDNVFVIQV